MTCVKEHARVNLGGSSNALEREIVAYVKLYQSLYVKENTSINWIQLVWATFGFAVCSTIFAPVWVSLVTALMSLLILIIDWMGASYLANQIKVDSYWYCNLQTDHDDRKIFLRYLAGKQKKEVKELIDTFTDASFRVRTLSIDGQMAEFLSVEWTDGVQPIVVFYVEVTKKYRMLQHKAF